MTAYQVYEQSIKPLPVKEKLAIAWLIMDEVVPNPTTEPSIKQSQQTVKYPSQFGCGRELLAGIDIDELLAVSIDDMFADYMPEEPDAAHH